MAEVALAWVNARVASPIVGVSSVRMVTLRCQLGSKPQVARLEEAMVSGKSLTEEESKYLEEPYVKNLQSR